MPIDYQSSLNRGSRLRAPFSWQTLGLLALISLLLTSFYFDIYRPDTLIKPATHLHERVKLPEPGHRGYFRNSFYLDFQPENAYLMLSTDDYQLYINGRKVGSDEYTINASNPFTGKLSQRSQSLSRTQQFSLARAPELQKVANRESRYAHYYDLTPYLVVGKNTLSIAVQSDSTVQFAIYGNFHSQVNTRYLSSNPAEWKYSVLANSDRESRAWYDVDFNDIEWQKPVSGGVILDHVYALDIESLWSTTFDPDAVIAPSGDGVQRIRAILPGRNTFKEHSESTSWLRFQSSLSYALYIGDELVGNGPPGQLGAFNVSRLMEDYDQPISVVLFPDRQGLDEQVWLKMDASINGNFVAKLTRWSKYENDSDVDDNWLSADISPTTEGWSPLQSTHLIHPTQKKVYVEQNSDDLQQDIDYAIKALLGFTVLMVLAFIHDRWASAKHGAYNVRCSYWWSLSLASILVAVIQALRYRFIESDCILFFLTDDAKWVFAVLIIAVLLLWIWPHRELGGREPLLANRAGIDLLKMESIGSWILFLVVLCGIYLRVFGIDSEDLQADENVSWDAARGILKVGSPEAASGVLYTRSPLYHYLLACWLWLFGDNMIVARLFSVVPAVGSIYLSYLVVKAITKNLWLALMTAFIISFDSWEIQISHIIRFYQQMQFFSLLATYYFLNGFVWRRGRSYQFAFLAACTAAGLSQEVFVTVFPAYGMAFVLFYRNFDWKKEYALLIGLATMLAIVIVDIYIFTITCLTPHVSVATTSGSILQLHLSKIMGFFNTFFVGNNRANILTSLVVFSGAFYWLRRNNKAVFFLYLIVGLTVITSTVLVMQIAARYLIAIYPYLIILAVLTLYYATGTLARKLNAIDARHGLPMTVRLLMGRRWLWLTRGLLVVAAVINLEPLRVLNSINHPRFPQHLTALEYIVRHKSGGDKILSVAPMQAAVALGGVDYYLQTKLFFDEMYLVDRGLVDRWAGGTLVTSTDRVREIFLRNERVWIILDDLEKRNLSEEVLAVLYQSSVIQQEYFGVEVLLWERGRGSLPVTENRGGSYNQF